MKNQRDYGTEIFNNQNKQLTSSNEQTHHGRYKNNTVQPYHLEVTKNFQTASI